MRYTLADQTIIIMDELKILDYFHDLKKDENPVLLWTKVEGGPERKLFFCHINHSNLVDHEIGVVNHDTSQPFAKFCEEEAEVFIYSEKDSMLLKSEIKRFHNDLLVVHFPKKINIVADQMKLNIHKTIEALDPTIKKMKETDQNESKVDEHGIEIETPEDQKLYAKLRAAPRGKADKGQTASIKVTKPDNSIGTSTNEVLDISRGGISILTSSPNNLAVGDQVAIMTINGDEPPFPLEGNVVSIKRIDLNEIRYKVGIKFNE